MSRKLTIIVLLLIAACVPAWAQSDDEIVTGSGDLRFERPEPVATASGLHRTHADNNCSRFFLEGSYIVGTDNDYGMGVSLAYVPRHWGGYGALYTLYHRTVGSVGGVLRPVERPRYLDWQLFAGAAFSDAVGYEVGMRFSATADMNGGGFAWWSGSISRLYVDRTAFFTVGFSFDIAALFTWIWF